jgi:translocation and assembly module TamB
MTGSKRRMGWLAGGLGALLLLLLFGAVGVMAWMNSDAGRERIQRLAGAALGDAGLALEIDGWAGRLPFELAMRTVEISDANGVLLGITELRMNWNPLALLWGQLRIESLTAESLLLERLPVSPSGEARISRLPRMILEARVARVAVERLEIGEAVLGERASWRVDGQIGTPDDHERQSYLDIARIDGRSDRLLARVHHRPKAGTLALDVSWIEAPGGAVAQLISLGSTEEIEVQISGSGPLEDWQGRLVGRAGQAEADLSFRLQIQDESRLTVTGRVDTAGRLPARYSALGAGDLEFSASVRRKENYQVIRVPALRFSTPSLMASGQGRLDRRDGSLAASVELVQANDGKLDALLSPVATEGLMASISIVGSLDEPRIEGSVRSERLSVAGVDGVGVELKASLISLQNIARPGRRLDVEASLRMRDVGWSLTGMEKLVRGPAVARLHGEIDGLDQVTLDALSVELPDAHLNGSLVLDLANRTLDAPLRLQVMDLDALDPLTRLDLEGTASAEVALSLPAFDGQVAIDVVGRTGEFSLGLPVVRSLVSPDMELAASLAISPQTGLAISGIRISSEHAVISGSVGFSPDYGKMEIDAEGSLPDVSVLSSALNVNLAGTGRVIARLSGPPGNPAIDGTLEVQQIDLPVGRWERVRGSYSLADLGRGGHGPVRLTGDGPTGPTRIESLLTIGDERVELREVSATADGIGVTGRISAPYSGAPLAGAFDASLDDIGPIMEGMTSREGSGRAAVGLVLADKDGRQDIRVSAVGERVRFMAGPHRPLSAERMELDVSITGRGETAVLEADGTAVNVSGPSVRLPVVNAEAKGTLADVRIAVRSEGRVLGAHALLSMEVDAKLRETQQQFILKHLTGSLDGQPIESGSLATLTIADGRLEMRDIDLRLGEGVVTGQARLGVPDAAVVLSIDDMPLALLKLVNPTLAMTGQLDSRIDLRSAGPRTEGTLDMSLSNVVLPYRRRAVPMSGSLEGRLSATGLALEARAATSPVSPVTITGEVPLEINLVDLRVGLRPQGRLQARLNWNGEAFEILSLLPLEDHLVNGAMSVALDLSGTVADPRVSGQVDLREGRYEHLLAGTVLSPLELRIEGDGESLRVTRLKAGDGEKGALEGEGRLSFDPGAGFPLEATLGFRNLTLVRRDEITGQASGDLLATGPLGGLKITGLITTEDVEARLINNLPPQVVELEVIEADTLEDQVNGVNGNHRQRKRLIEGNLDVGISMPRRVFVRGLGLDSEWEGELTIRGTLSRPEIVGRLESIRGVMMFLGRRFRIESSSLLFTGGRDIEPQLDVRATHDGEELTVTVNLTGPITNPDLTLSSVPSVPEDEILARTLFGKSTGQLSAGEAVQLAAAVGELTARGGGPGVLARLREVMGVDVLRFGSVETAEGEQATTVEAGSYIAEGLYVGVETSTVEEHGTVTVEYEVTRRIRVTTDLKQTGGQNIGVEYKRDY